MASAGTTHRVPQEEGRGKLIGVGVGPGDPDLLTRQALAVLGRADRVVAPTSAPGVPGRAEAVVRQALPGVEVTRLVFDMASGPPSAVALAAEARRASHRRAARTLRPWLEEGRSVAFVTLGDPHLYSTFSALVSALRAEGWHGEVATVPGITAFQALAAATGTVLTDGDQPLALVTALQGTAQLAEALEEPERAVVVYKGGRHLAAIAELLASKGRLEGAVVGEHLGLDDERVVPLTQAGERPASYLATVIVPPGGPR